MVLIQTVRNCGLPGKGRLFLGARRGEIQQQNAEFCENVAFRADTVIGYNARHAKLGNMNRRRAFMDYLASKSGSSCLCGHLAQLLRRL